MLSLAPVPDQAVLCLPDLLLVLALLVLSLLASATAAPLFAFLPFAIFSFPRLGACSFLFSLPFPGFHALLPHSVLLVSALGLLAPGRCVLLLLGVAALARGLRPPTP